MCMHRMYIGVMYLSCLVLALSFECVDGTCCLTPILE